MKKKKKVSIFFLSLEPMGSMSSMEVNVDMLEQMDLMDISDQEALDVFLNSNGEDNIVLSPGLGKSHNQTSIKLLNIFHEPIFLHVGKANEMQTVHCAKLKCSVLLPPVSYF